MAATVADAIRSHARGLPILLGLDGDAAGRAATTRLREQLTDTQVRVLRIPDHQDLTTLHASRKDRSCPTVSPLQATPPASSRG